MTKGLHQKKLTVATCMKCGTEWVPRVPVPKQCPYCHSKTWATPPRNKKLK